MNLSDVSRCIRQGRLAGAEGSGAGCDWTRNMSKGLIVDVLTLWSVHQSNCNAALELGQYLSDRLGLHPGPSGQSHRRTC